MRKDNLEEFVTGRKDLFDNKTPSANVWSRIERTLFGATGTNTVWNSVSIWRAAAILMLGLSLYLFFTPSRVAVRQDMAGQQDFVDAESYYTMQISEKTALISNEGLLDDSFTQEIQKLEAMYSVLAEEMKQHPSSSVRDALVLNMLIRIDLLNQQIQKLEESRRSKDKSAAA